MYPPARHWSGNILAPFRSLWTVRRAAYVALRFPLSLGYFIVMMVGIAVGGALSWTIVGVGVLAAVVLAVRWFGDLEAQLSRHLAGVPFTRPHTWLQRNVPLRDQARQIVTDRSTWTGAIYMSVDLAIGIATLVIMSIAVWGSVWLTMGPLIASGTWPYGEAHRVMDLGFWRVDTVAEALMFVPLGLAMAVGVAHLVNAWAYFEARWAGMMLGSNPIEEVLEQAA